MLRGTLKTSVAVLALAVLASGGYAQITNPGFEAGGGSLSGWTSFLLAGKTGGAAILNPSTHFPSPANYEGNNRAGNSDGSSGNLIGGGIFQRVSGLTAGAGVGLGFYGVIRAADFSGVPDEGDDFLSLYWINSGTANFAGGLPASAVLLDQFPSPQQTWRLLTGQIVPSGTAAYIIAVWEYGGFAWVANSSHVDAWELGTVGPTFTHTNTPIPTATPTCPVVPEQALINGDFELGNMTGWNGPPGAQTGDFFGASPFQGNWMWGAATNGLDLDGNLYQQITWCGGTSLTAFCYINTEQMTTTGAGLRIGIDPNGGTNVNSPSIVWSAYTRADQGWIQINTGAVTVASPKTVTVFIQFDGSITAPGAIWNIFRVDQVQISGSGTPPTPPTPTPTLTPTSACVNDFDGDGVCDEQESVGPAPQTANQTNRYLPDSDGDGLWDGVEDANKNGQPDPGETLARVKDTDADGVEDGVEVLIMGTNPLVAGSPVTDADGDKLPASVDPNDGNKDTDDDRRTDGYEAVTLGMAAVTDPSQIPQIGNVLQNPGDPPISRDAGVDNADSQMILNFFGNAPVAPGFDPKNGDVNRDAFIENGDSQLTLSFFGKVINFLPFEP